MIRKVSLGVGAAVLLVLSGCGWVQGGIDDRNSESFRNAIKSDRCFDAEEYADKAVDTLSSYEMGKEIERAKNWYDIYECYQRAGNTRLASMALETARGHDEPTVRIREGAERRAAARERERRERQAQLERVKQAFAKLPNHVQVKSDHPVDIVGIDKCVTTKLFNAIERQVVMNHCPVPVWVALTWSWNYRVFVNWDVERGNVYKIESGRSCAEFAIEPGGVDKSIYYGEITESTDNYYYYPIYIYINTCQRLKQSV